MLLLLERKRLIKLRQQEYREKGRRVWIPSIAADEGFFDGEGILIELVGADSLTEVESSAPSSAQDLINQEQSGDVHSFEVQRSKEVESKISIFVEQEYSQHGANSLNKNVDKFHLCERNIHLNVDTVSAEETGEAQNESNLRKNLAT